MCSTEENDVLLRRSRGGELLESEVEAESNVESVVRGKKDESGSGGVEEGAGATGTTVSILPGFGENDSSDSVDGEDVESCAKTGSFHSATSEDRLDLDFLANKQNKLFYDLKGCQPFLGFCERVLLTSTFIVSDDGQDEDCVPSSRTRSQVKKKRRASCVLSAGKVEPAHRVRLADIMSGTVPKPPRLQDSCGADYETPIISSSRTLKSWYPVYRLAICRCMCPWVSLRPFFPHIFDVCCISSR